MKLAVCVKNLATNINYAKISLDLWFVQNLVICATTALAVCAILVLTVCALQNLAVCAKRILAVCVSNQFLRFVYSILAVSTKSCGLCHWQSSCGLCKTHFLAVCVKSRGLCKTHFLEYQKEVNEIHAERIAKNANPLVLVAAAQQYPGSYYQAPKSHKSYAPPSKQSSSTRSHAYTRYKGKEIAKPITPPSESASKEDNDPEQAQKDKECRKTWHLFQSTLKRSTNLPTTTLELLQTPETRMWILLQEMQETKKVKDYTCHKEKMLLCKQAEKGVTSQVEQADWLEDTDEEIDKQELEAHYSYMEKIQEVPTVDSRTDSEPLKKTNQNAEECDDERVVLANLIANLKLDIDENKKIQKQLKKANTSLTQELKECKSTLEDTNRTLAESNSTRDSCLIALQNRQTELETYKTLNDRTIDYDKLERKLNETLGLLAQKESDIK
nr:hypothetical protein [Tanacetum cinerariifolium]